MRLSVLVKVPSFSRLGGARQHNIGISARVAEEDVLHDEEVELGECVTDIVRVGVDDAHFLADEIHRLELAGMNGFDHLVVVEPLGGRQLHLPTRLKSLAHFGIIHRLIARQHVWHGPVVAGALHVVVAAQRISAGSRPHVVAGDEQQIRNRGGGVGTLAVLSHSHRPENAHGLRFGRSCARLFSESPRGTPEMREAASMVKGSRLFR